MTGKKTVWILAMLIVIQAIGIVVYGKAPLPFEDVSYQDENREAIAYVYQKNIMKGMSDTLFSSETAMTKAMLAEALYRIEGSPKPEETIAVEDAGAGHPYENAVQWILSEGIETLYGGMFFYPDEPLTREKTVQFIFAYISWKYGEAEGRADLSVYEDADQISEDAKDAMAWAVDARLMQGDDAHCLNPREEITREQAAILLMRLHMRTESE